MKKDKEECWRKEKGQSSNDAILNQQSSSQHNKNTNRNKKKQNKSKTKHIYEA